MRIGQSPKIQGTQTTGKVRQGARENGAAGWVPQRRPHPPRPRHPGASQWRTPSKAAKAAAPGASGGRAAGGTARRRGAPPSPPPSHPRFRSLSRIRQEREIWRQMFAQAQCLPRNAAPSEGEACCGICSASEAAVWWLRGLRAHRRSHPAEWNDYLQHRLIIFFKVWGFPFGFFSTILCVENCLEILMLRKTWRLNPARR